jgi:hypothetical protein
MEGDRTYYIGPVEVTRHRVDWANADPDFIDFSNATLRRIMALPAGFRDHIYLNPAFTVRAPSSVPEDVFLRQANRACILWNKQIASVLGNRKRKRAARNATDLNRQTVFSGFLMIHGKEVHAKKLNQAAALPQ